MHCITRMRKKYNYSQEKLAKMLGVHQTAVSQWELGRTLPDILTAQKLSLIFGVTIEDLINDACALSDVLKIRNNCEKLNEEAVKKVLDYTNDLIMTGVYNRARSIPDSTEEAAPDGND